MSWRTIVVSGRAKLDLKMNNLVIRKEEVFKIHISEISVLIIESTAVSITSALIAKLIEEKVKIIFCDTKHNPVGEVVNYYNKHNTVSMIKKQILWTDKNKKNIWSEIIRSKILNQAKLLKYKGNNNYKLLEKYASEIELGDVTNREGHAAKVYFNSLFGKSFTRDDEENPINAMLNFGYSIILSAFTREITSSGYLTQLGVFHDNQFNYFNLASDFMEPFRQIVDRIVVDNIPTKFGKEEKAKILSLLENRYLCCGKSCTLMNAVTLYSKSLFEALEKGDKSLIRFIEYEL